MEKDILTEMLEKQYRLLDKHSRLLATPILTGTYPVSCQCVQMKMAAWLHIKSVLNVKLDYHIFGPIFSYQNIIIGAYSGFILELPWNYPG